MQRNREQGRTDREQGTALLLAIFLTIFALGIVLSSTAMMEANETRTDTEYLVHGQATNFARSGLTEAINWLRRQPSQPVTTFAPVQDLVATPPVEDTIEPEIGLVREFQITGLLWGRYEVWKQWDSDPDPVRLAWRQKHQARDVSTLRDMTVPGSTWALQCLSYIYRRTDGAVPFDQKPNLVLASDLLSVEVSRLAITIPGQAALCAHTGSTINVSTSGEILGGVTAAGIFYEQGTGAPTITGSVSGTPQTSPSATYQDTTVDVFGVSLERLRAMADDYITDPTLLPNPLPSDSLLVVEAGPLTFDSTRPLTGSGILYVKGDVTVLSASNSFFSGLLYVDGNLTMSGPAEIQGCAVVTGSVTLGGGSDVATIAYSDPMLESVQNLLGNYRISRSMVRER